MKLSKANYGFSLFALFVIFADELFYGFVSLAGMGLQSGMKSREAIVIAGIAYFLLIKDVVNHRLSNRNYIQLISLFVLLALYYMTQFFFPVGNMKGEYMAHFLVYGSLCIPACYVGIRLARGLYNEEVLNLLPIFVIAVSAIVAVAVVTTSMTGAILNSDEDVFNYQSASYYLSYCFSYSFFYIFLNNDKSGEGISKLVNIVMLIMLFVCAIGCLLGGGRGALLYLVSISVFIIFKLIKQNGKMKGTTIMLLLIAAGVMLFLFNYFQIFESTGFLRVTETLTNDDARSELWNSATKVFFESPIIGHGLGSIWWTVGFYSHNMLIDFLAETGLLGTTIFVVVLIKLFISLYKRSKASSFDMFIFLVFLGAMIEYSFSGYWFSAPKLFLVFGYVLGMKRNKRHFVNG